MNSNLKEITTQRQLKNGTRMFQCTLTGDLYASYSSGYVRRKNANSYRPYQLNKKRFTKRFSIWSNKEYDCVERVMIESEQDRLDLINQRNLKIISKLQS